MTMERRRWMVPLIIGAMLIGADQASKYWVVQTLGPLPLQSAINLAGDWLRIIYSHNTGVAFSLFQGFSQVLTFTALAIIGGAIYFYWLHLPNRSLPIQISLGLILGGAFGNLIDRVRLGYVVDFIQVGWWPVFNIADSAITVGAVLLMLYGLRAEATQRRQEQAAAQ